MVCINGMIFKAQVTIAYRHIARRILDDLPGVFNQVYQHLLRQRNQLHIIMESRVNDPLAAKLTGLSAASSYRLAARFWPHWIT
jgi:hypothetical protein